MNSLIDEQGNIHITGHVWPDFPTTSTWDFWLFSVDANGCHNGDCSDVVDLDSLVTSAHRELISDNIQVYPNPTNGLVYLEDIQNGVDVKIYNLQGVLQKKERYIHHTGLDLSRLNQGVYSIEAEGYTARKIVKM